MRYCTGDSLPYVRAAVFGKGIKMEQTGQMADRKCVTVTGSLPAEQLGFCQSHEHLLLRKGQSFLVNEALWQDEPEKSLAELKMYRGAGGSALVDAQPVGCGRMAEELRQISQASQVHVIASTGFHKLVFYPENHWIFNWPAGQLADLFVRELTEGMYEDGDDKEPGEQTSVLAGQIKTALDTEGLTSRYERLFGAAADAAKKTGAPVMIHVENQADPIALFRFFAAEGIPAGQLIFCHLDRACADPDVHVQLAKEGAWLEYDTIGRFKYHSDEEEVRIIRYMTDHGYAGRLLLSLDTTRKRLGAYGGDIDLSYLIRQFIPCLEETGVTGDEIRLMTVTNPAAAFSWR